MGTMKRERALLELKNEALPHWPTWRKKAMWRKQERVLLELKDQALLELDAKELLERLFIMDGELWITVMVNDNVSWPVTLKTIDDVRSVLNRVVKKLGNDECVAILEECGAKCVSELNPKLRPYVIWVAAKKLAAAPGPTSLSLGFTTKRLVAQPRKEPGRPR